MNVATDAILLVLIGALLGTGATGHAGVQVLDRALAADLFHIHPHGVPGEADYVAEHGTWIGFVPYHCHPLPDHHTTQPNPDEVQAASALAGAAACNLTGFAPVAGPSQWHSEHGAAPSTPVSRALSPLLRPPR